MVALETLRTLYNYNYWARDRQLEACVRLSQEQFLRPMGSSFSSLRDTLAHLVAVEWVWHERFLGRSPRSVPEWVDALRTTEAIRSRWAEVEADVRKFVGGLDAAALDRPLSYQNLKGEPWTYPLWQALFHLVNHQTYHRGQVTTLVRQLGGTPPAIDFLVYFDSSK